MHLILYCIDRCTVSPVQYISQKRFYLSICGQVTLQLYKSCSHCLHNSIKELLSFSFIFLKGLLCRKIGTMLQPNLDETSYSRQSSYKLQDLIIMEMHG